MPLWAWLLVAIVLVVLARAAFSVLFERVTVMEYERALEYRRGRLAGIRGGGRYLISRRTTSMTTVDIRPRFVSIPGQDVLTSDAVTLRVSLAARYEVADPVVAVNEVEDFSTALYLTLQLALREIVGATPIDELLEQRARLGAEVLERAREPVEALGLTLHRVELKDITFPGDLKRTFAQVVTARKEGLAALERARGETAALRNLANAARLLDGNPALMQLRLLQHIGETRGNTIVLGLPASTTPLPLREVDGGQPPELPPEPVSEP